MELYKFKVYEGKRVKILTTWGEKYNGTFSLLTSIKKTCRITTSEQSFLLGLEDIKTIRLLKNN